MIYRWFLSISSGLLLFLSWPPNNSFSFFIFFSLVPLLVIETQIQKKQLKYTAFFLYSYLSFFIFNCSTTFWIYHAHFGGAIFAILCNSLFMAFVFYLYAKIKNSYNSKKLFFLLPVLWISFEYLHLNWDLSWPWLSLGNVFAANVDVIQWFSFTGVLGGSLWILIVNLLVAKILTGDILSYKIIRKIIITVLIIISPIYISKHHLFHSQNHDDNKSINALIVQPNIDPYKDKFRLKQFQQTDLVISTISPYLQNEINCIILPETFLTNPIWEHKINNNLDIKRLKEIVLNNDNLNSSFNTPLNIIVGATTLTKSNHNLVHNAQQTYRKIHNSAVHIGYNLEDIMSVKYEKKFKIDIYHKSKLVPGAEQIPFYNFLQYFVKNQLLQIGSSTSLGNFTKQDTVSLFSSFFYANNKEKPVGGLSVDQYFLAPIICYESIYGDYVRKFVYEGANLILIITNDGWWNDTPGYKQHHAYAKLRAIETRRYIARSANTGISSVIDPFGNIEHHLDWNIRGVIEAKLPLLSKNTFYVLYGDYLGRISSFLAVLFILVFLLNNKLSISRR